MQPGQVLENLSRQTGVFPGPASEGPERLQIEHDVIRTALFGRE
jgi:hypothetical protein